MCIPSTVHSYSFNSSFVYFSCVRSSTTTSFVRMCKSFPLDLPQCTYTKCSYMFDNCFWITFSLAVSHNQIGLMFWLSMRMSVYLSVCFWVIDLGVFLTNITVHGSQWRVYIKWVLLLWAIIVFFAMYCCHVVARTCTMHINMVCLLEHTYRTL